MTVSRTEFSELAAAMMEKHPSLFELADERATAERLLELERRLGCELPGDFKWFLAEYGGGYFGYAMTYSADPANTMEITENQFAIPRSAGVIAFSDDGTGNVFAFPVRESTCADEIVLWSHESGEIRSLPDSGFLEFVANRAFPEG